MKKVKKLYIDMEELNYSKFKKGFTHEYHDRPRLDEATGEPSLDRG